MTTGPQPKKFITTDLDYTSQDKMDEEEVKGNLPSVSDEPFLSLAGNMIGRRPKPKISVNSLRPDDINATNTNASSNNSFAFMNTAPLISSRPAPELATKPVKKATKPKI